MPKTIRNGKYGRTKGRPRGTWRPRLRVASTCSDVAADVLKSLLVHDPVPGRLRVVRETLAERRQLVAERLARYELRDDGGRPDRLVLVGDHAPPLPDESCGRLHRRPGRSREVRVLVQLRQPEIGGGAVRRITRRNCLRCV